MSTNSNQNLQDQEIDLSVISKKVNGFTVSVKNQIFNAILFVIKYKIVLGVLLILGVIVGVYLDRTNKSYENQIVVAPNFGSSDYLYAKIDLINSKIKESDTMFLKKIGVLEPLELAKIEIKPIIDVYQFVSANEKNFEMLKLMAEDNDMKKLLEERPTSKNYNFHLITLKTKEKTSNEKTITPLLNFLNNSAYYSKIQREELKNIQISMKANDLILSQIDNFLNGIGSGKATGEKLVYYNENSPLNDIIESKERIVRDQGYKRVGLVRMDKIIKEVSQVINIENKESVNDKMKLIVPFLFLFLFVVGQQFISFYQSQSLKRKANIS